eukprot:scaffold347_cov239-Pinguiococcus_pyrenoidosus.AAC.6
MSVTRGLVHGSASRARVPSAPIRLRTGSSTVKSISGPGMVTGSQCQASLLLPRGAHGLNASQRRQLPRLFCAARVLRFPRARNCTKLETRSATPHASAAPETEEAPRQLSRRSCRYQSRRGRVRRLRRVSGLLGLARSPGKDWNGFAANGVRPDPGTAA